MRLHRNSKTPKLICMPVDLFPAKSSHLTFYCNLVVQNAVKVTAKPHEEAKEKESTKTWGTVPLLQHQRENLSQVSKAHQTHSQDETHLSHFSCLVLTAETLRTKSISVFLLFLKPLFTSSLRRCQAASMHRKANTYFLES